MLNLSRIQLELEKAKEGLREVEETIQKVEGKTFLNGPGRYVNIKVQVHSDKSRNLLVHEDSKIQRKNISSNVELRSHRFTSDDPIFNSKRNTREKRDGGFKRQSFDTRPQSISVRLMGSVGSAPSTVDDDDDDEFTKKLSLPSRVISTASEAPSRQDIIAAQAGDEMVKQRNRRMFGALVGTLQKFCKEETRVREREEKRMKVEKKLEEDAKREREKLLQEKRELFLERKRREVEIKRIEWSLNRVKEYEAWEANVLPLKNFIQTHAKPHIFYLPNTHNSKTEERLAESQKTVERMIEKRKNNLKEEIENSEKKAKRTAAEEEVEEAENIPHDDSGQKDEDGADIDFDASNKENGYHPQDSKTEAMEILEEEEGDGNEEEAWSDKDAEAEGEKSNSGLIGTIGEPQMEDQDFVITTCVEGARDGGNSNEGDNDGRNNNEGDVDGGNNNEGDNDGGGGNIEDSGVTGKGRTLDEEKRNNKRRESYDNKANEPESDTQRLPTNESENTRKLTEKEITEFEYKSPFQEKTEDGKKEEYGSELDKKLNDSDGDNDDDTAKKAENIKKDHERRSEVSPKKSKRRYRSRGRRSKSPRRFAKTRRRSRSSSRKRNSNRRSHSYSKSPSPSKKSRRSPKFYRRSGRGSPPPKRRSSRSRRKSSSKSSSSASPKKRMKFRSPTSSNSRSDSD